MLKLKNFNIDESKTVHLIGKTLVVEFIPAIVEILVLSGLSSEIVEKIFHYLFSDVLTGSELKDIPETLKLKTIKKIFKKEIKNTPEKEEEYETTVDFAAMLLFITSKTNISKNELLTRYTLSELLHLTNNLKGKEETPFFKHQKIAKSISELQSLLK